MEAGGGAVRLASRALTTALCCMATSKDLARVRPSLFHGSRALMRGRGADPGHAAFLKALLCAIACGGFVWMTDEVGRVRRTVGPRGSYAPAHDPRSPVHAASLALRWTGRAGAGVGWWVYSDRRCERAEARRASMAVRCA